MGVTMVQALAQEPKAHDQANAPAAWAPERAAEYLDDRMNQWLDKATKLRTGEGRTPCISCHTVVPYDREHGGPRGEPWKRTVMSDVATAFAALALLSTDGRLAAAAEPRPTEEVSGSVDATTIQHKVMAGYQGLKVTSAPPIQGHFVGYEGLPSDWYLRLVGEGARLLKRGLPVPVAIPIRP